MQRADQESLRIQKDPRYLAQGQGIHSQGGEDSLRRQLFELPGSQSDSVGAGLQLTGGDLAPLDPVQGQEAQSDELRR